MQTIKTTGELKGSEKQVAWGYDLRERADAKLNAEYGRRLAKIMDKHVKRNGDEMSEEEVARYREKMTAKLDAEFGRYADGLASIRYAKTFIEFRAHFDEHGEFSGSIFDPEGMSFGWYQSMPAWERYGIEMGDLK